MIIDKNEIAIKLKKLKGILSGCDPDMCGVLVKSNTLYATNVAISIRVALNIPESDEQFVIPRSAMDLIDNLPQDTVHITCDKTTLNIKCGKIKNRFKTLAVDNFPEEKSVETADGLKTLNGGEFMDGLESVLYAVSENATKEVMKGVLLEARGGKLNMVGCDGYRAAWSRLDYDGEFEVVVPKATVKQLLALGATGDVSLAWDDRRIMFKCGEWEIYSRILAGEYFKYRVAFTKGSNETIIDRKRLLECLRRALICCEDKVNKAVVCDFSGAELSVKMMASNSEYEETIGLDAAVDAPLKIGYNGKYLMQILDSFMSEKISVSMGGATDITVLTDGDLDAMLLPVRIGGKK